VRQLPNPQLAHGDLLVQIARAGVCGSDVAVFLGERPATYPLVMGHEVIGYVVERQFGARSTCAGCDRAKHSVWAVRCLPARSHEFPDPGDIELSTFVNGERRQHSRTSSLIWPVSYLLSFLSERTTRMPGDIVSTGTPASVGHADGRYLRPGDSITIRVSGVGELTNVVAGSR
jgi:Fumarylacetoacetate (FAA) hydrolase family/Alcohol dehydrogenase GroES-like domain